MDLDKLDSKPYMLKIYSNFNCKCIELDINEEKYLNLILIL